jgi:hydroxyquinol 1,2-dioxygenase
LTEPSAAAGSADHGSADHAELTAAVLRSFEQTPDPRLRVLLEALTRHLHAFVEETRLTLPEWAAAVDFLTATGQRSDATRQEFILLSDVLGVSSLVESVNHDAGLGETESTVLGPFHVVASPPRGLGDDIALGGAEGAAVHGERCVVTGRVLSTDGSPLPGATIDVWQADGDGFYDVQVPEAMDEGSLRGLFEADGEGRFWFRTVVPKHYAIPTDGPVGTLLGASARHPYRPAHIHMIGAAPGYEPVTTHVFVAGSPYIDGDAVFGTKASLVREFELDEDPEAAARFMVEAPFRRVEFDLVLPPRAA